MTYIETVPEEEATGDVAALYEFLRDAPGELPNYGRIFSHRPELMDIWVTLNTTVRRGMDFRRYELATLAAASTIRSTYCTLAHGEKLLGIGETPDHVRAIARGDEAEDLSEEDRAVLSYARKVARDAASVTQDDIDRMRAAGLDDTEIFHIAAAVAIRCFFSTLIDAVGTSPDARWRDLLPDLAGDLQVGRPIESG